MSFVECFYNFIIDFSSNDKNLYQRIKLKLPLYPNEALSALIYRMLAYHYCYSADLQVSANPQSEQEPTLFEKDAQDLYLQWVFVGLPDIKSLHRAVRRYDKGNFSIFFTEKQHIERFCHGLRGTKENWIAAIQFYLIEFELIEELTHMLTSSSHWQINHVEQTFYMESELLTAEVHFTPLDIWHEYQKNLTHQSQ